jgi:3-oxoacyl-[acyl-carrier protein] reductase
MSDVRVALVTGGAGGIGQAINHRLVDAGYTVLAGDLRSGLEAADPSGPGIDAIELDVADETSVRAAVAAALELGPLRTVVNCAGIVRSIPVDAFDAAAASALWEVNVAGMARVCSAAVPSMTEGATVVNVGSITGALGFVPDVSLYGASKAGVAAYTRYLGCQLAPRGIRVNALAPGFIDVPMSPDWEAASGGREALRATVPLGRLGEVEEMAEVVEFLASERSSYLVGTTIYADGGVIAR